MPDKTEAQPEALRLAELLATSRHQDISEAGHLLSAMHAELQQLNTQITTQTNRAAAAEQQVTALTQRLDMANRLNTDAREQLAQLSARQAAQLIIARKEDTVDFVKEILAEAADELRKTTAPEDYEIEDRTCYAKDLDAIATMLSAAPPQPGREPLTDEQIDDIFRAMYGCEPDASGEFSDVCRRVEAAHGIGATND